MLIQDLGSTILHRRQELGLTQNQLGAAAGISQQHISLIENGKIEPDWRTLQRLSAVLGMELKVELTREPIQTHLAKLNRFNAWERTETPKSAPEALRLAEELTRLFPQPRKSLATQAAGWKRWRANLAHIHT